MEQTPRIGIIDDDLAILECVGEYLERHESLQVVGYAGHAQAGLAMVLDKHPDLVLLDIHMPGADAFWACRQIVSRTKGGTKVLFFTGFPRDQYLDRSIAAGASGMLSKHAEKMETVAFAIRHVLRGDTYYSPELEGRLLQLRSQTPKSRFTTLSPREIDVLRQLSIGRTNRQIAASLAISLRSVEKEVADLKAKLNLQSINELIMFAANEGLLFPELQHKQSAG